MIRKVLNLKPGNAITRQYRNAKKARPFCAANTIIACALGFEHAKQHNNILFIDMINIFLFGRLTEKSHALIKQLEPEYKNIVTRAKSIFGNHKVLK